MVSEIRVTDFEALKSQRTISLRRGDRILDIQTITVVIAGISVVIGVINSIMSNRKAEEQRQTEIQTRQAELFMPLYNRWISRDFAEIYARTKYEYQYHDLDDYWQKYGAHNNINAYVDHFMRGGFYEGLVSLCNKG